MRLRPGTFVGESTSKIFADAILSEVTHREARVVVEHSHEWPYISLLLSGAYRETVGQKTIVFGPFTAVFHDRNLEHTDAIGDGGARFFLLELGPGWRETLEAAGPIPDHVHELHGEGASWPLLRLYHRFVSDELSDEVVEDAIFEIAGHLPNADAVADSEPEWLRDVDAWLERHFREPYSLARVAREMHVNAAHLARTFVRFRHRTMGDFVSRLRVQDACRQLAEFEHTLEEVALSAGFSDQSHMTRVIRQVAGGTPGALRRSLR
jgi:AraC family transcriptional regulator